MVWKCQLHYLEFHIITLAHSSDFLLFESLQVPSDLPCKDKQAEAEVSSTFLSLCWMLGQIYALDNLN